MQSDEWRLTSRLLRDILEDHLMPPTERVRALVHAFLRSECEEATIRIALNDAAPFYRDAPEAAEAHAESAHIVRAFLFECAPHVSDAQRTLARSDQDDSERGRQQLLGGPSNAGGNSWLCRCVG